MWFFFVLFFIFLLDLLILQRLAKRHSPPQLAQTWPRALRVVVEGRLVVKQLTGD